MSEEEQLELDLSEEPVEGEAEEIVEEVVEEYTPAEQEAMGKGWNPEGAEGKRTLTADEYLDRQPLYDELHKRKREVKKLADKQNALTAHLEQIRKGQVEDKIDRLKRDKRTALEEDDHDRVMEIDEKIIEIHGEAPIEIPQENDSAMFDAWEDDNAWYGADPKMRRYADALGKEMAESNGGRLTNQDLAEISTDVKETFAKNFTPPPKRSGSPVEGSRPRSKARAAKYTVKDLDSDALKIHDDLVRDKVMTSEEYIKDLEMTDYFN